jgi:SanA protein
MRRLPRYLRWFLLLATLLAVSVLTINLWMTLRSRDRIHTSPAAVPATGVALVLGTGKTTHSGLPNVHFRVRMDAAASLYQSGRVRHFLVSGDNSRPDYNEPEDMKQALITRGVPATAVTCDFAGLRTLDSIVRARQIFGVTRCVIVSDDFHLARALWLADLHGITATAFHTEVVSWNRSGKTRVREWLARVNAVADEIIGKEPKFGGPRIELPVAKQ